MNRGGSHWNYFVSVAISCYASIWVRPGPHADDKAYKSLTVYGEVLQKIQQDYVDDPNMRTVTAGSLHGCWNPGLSVQLPHAPRIRRVQEEARECRHGGDRLTLSKRYGYIIFSPCCRIVRAQRREFAAATFSNPSADLPLATMSWARP